MGNDSSQQHEIIEIDKTISDAIKAYSIEFSKLNFKEQRTKILNVKVSKTFKFDLNKCIPNAKYVLFIDKNIQNLRQKTVPQLINEDGFWKRYFYIIYKKYKVCPISQEEIIPINEDNDLNDIIMDQITEETTTDGTDDATKTNGATESNGIKSKDSDLNINSKKNDNNNNNNTINGKTNNDVDKTSKPKNGTSKDIENITDIDEPYQVLLIKPIVFLYKIPATLYRHRNNKCQHWNLRNPLWQGRLRIVGYNHGKEIELQFLELDNKTNLYKIYLKGMRIDLTKIDDELNPLHLYFDCYGVIDSSRYFIFWVETPTKIKKKIPFGFGLKERQDAFDIRACIADQMRFVIRQENINNLNNNNNNNSDNDNDNEYTNINDNNINIETGEFDLKDDEMIEIGTHAEVIKITNNNDNNNNNNNDINLNDLILPGPPSPPPSHYIDKIKLNDNNNKYKDINDSVINNNDDNIDWTDFQGSTNNDDNDPN